MNRSEIVDVVKNTICNDRQNQYGEPEDSFGMVAKLWSVYLSEQIKPADVAIMMSLLKVARFRNCPGHLDNAVDGAGYFILAGELVQNDHSKGQEGPSLQATGPHSNNGFYPVSEARDVSGAPARRRTASNG